MNVLAINDLVKRYGEYTAVDHFNLHVKKGEILGLLGPNGSGKTTTINCALALLNHDFGTVSIFDQTMSPTAYQVKQKIGVVPQNVAVFNELTVFENIDFFCGLYITDKTVRRQYVNEAIAFVGLQEFTKHYPKELSGGLLRRLNIACGIAHKPEFIIFDEPTVAVDPQSRNKILEGIIALNQQGSTILYTSHYMEEIEKICSRIVIMDNGKEIAQGTKESLKALSKYGEIIIFETYNINDQHLNEIRNFEFVYQADYCDNVLKISCKSSQKNLINLVHYFNENQLDYLSVRNELPTLNDVFLEITGKALRD